MPAIEHDTRRQFWIEVRCKLQPLPLRPLFDDIARIDESNGARRLAQFLRHAQLALSLDHTTLCGLFLANRFAGEFSH